mgnify:CR=1 FL=1
MTLLIKIIEGHHIPDSRVNGTNTFWTQKMYVDNGGPFPIECKLSIPDMSKALRPGTYSPTPAAYQAGKYGDLELNRFDLYKNLKPVLENKPAASKAG